jgi:hypothetical protein
MRQTDGLVGRRFVCKPERLLCNSGVERCIGMEYIYYIPPTNSFLAVLHTPLALSCIHFRCKYIAPKLTTVHTSLQSRTLSSLVYR